MKNFILIFLLIPILGFSSNISNSDQKKIDKYIDQLVLNNRPLDEIEGIWNIKKQRHTVDRKSKFRNKYFKSKNKDHLYGIIKKGSRYVYIPIKGHLLKKNI